MPRRLALLIATYRYQDSGLSQLTAPGYDAEALAAILRDPDIADFEVTILRNEPNHVVGRAIGDFYRNRRRDDLTFLYFTGHGLKDDHGDLYLAMSDTNRDNLLYTAVSAQHIDRSMGSCLSRQQVLVLDCCYSGAFPVGRIPKADRAVHTLTRFQGKGRVVLTASDATQYSFEGNEISGQGTHSVFTRFFVEGLTTGKADLDGDGDICLDELYTYVYDRVIEEMPQQRPKKQENVEGRIVIARNVLWTLPTYLCHAIESPIASDRLAALDGLSHLYRIGNEFVRSVVADHFRRLIDDDNKAVSAVAVELMKKLKPRELEQSVENSRIKINASATIDDVAKNKTISLAVTLPSNDATATSNQLSEIVSTAQVQNLREPRFTPGNPTDNAILPVTDNWISRTVRLVYQRLVRLGKNIVKWYGNPDRLRIFFPLASLLVRPWSRRRLVVTLSVIFAVILLIAASLLVTLTHTTPVDPPPAVPSSTQPFPVTPSSTEPSPTESPATVSPATKRPTNERPVAPPPTESVQPTADEPVRPTAEQTPRDRCFPFACDGSTETVEPTTEPTTRPTRDTCFPVGCEPTETP